MKIKKEILAHYKELLNEKTKLQPLWKDLDFNFLPTRYYDSSMSMGLDNTNISNPKLINSAGVLAVRTLAAGMQGGMTSPARAWFTLSLENKELSKAQNVQRFLSTVTTMVRGFFNKSNFYDVIHTLYADLGTFGTGVMFQYYDPKVGFIFKNIEPNQYVLALDKNNRVDTIFCEYWMTPKQIIERYPRKAPEYIKKLYEKGLNKKFKVINGVYPRKSTVYGRVDVKNKPFESIHWLEESSLLLETSGFDSLPFYAPRWNVMSKTPYGRSPAMDCLPDCKMLQNISTSLVKAIHKSIDPPLSVDAALKDVGVDLRPGGITYIDMKGGGAPLAATPILNVRLDINSVQQYILQLENKIKETLFNPLFQAFLTNKPQYMTATETDAKEREKLLLVGPVLERLNNELTIPLIKRSVQLMFENGIIPAESIPEELLQNSSELRIEFVSLLAKAQQLESTNAINSLVSFVGNVSALYPEAPDTLDMDTTISDYADTLGVPADMLRPQEERDKLRQGRAEQQQAMMEQQQKQQQLGQVLEVAKAAKDLGVDVGEQANV